MKKVLVTGAGGQLGRHFEALAHQASPMEWHFADQQQLDLLDFTSVNEAFHRLQPDFCINCAAYTAVDKAEAEPELAQAVNVDAVAHLAQVCAVHNCMLIHFSSDYVYHNGLNRPLREKDPTTPHGVYARTKLAGEQAALQKWANTIVIRTSWVYGPYGHNFFHTMQRLGREREELRIVYDQVGAPTYTGDLVELVHRILERNPPLSGIFNFANAGVCSWYDFALAIMELSGISCSILPILSKDYPTPAARPSFSLLDTEKIIAALEVQIPHWRDSLKACISAQ